jgi:hypothetical protein
LYLRHFHELCTTANRVDLHYTLFKNYLQWISNSRTDIKFTIFTHRRYRIFLLVNSFLYLANSRGPGLLKENSALNRSQARAEKPGGPPIHGLLGSMSPGYSGTPGRYGGTPSRLETPSGTPGRYGTPGRLEAPTVATVQDLSGQDPLATWVTVFGFPPAAASFVLSQVNININYQVVE